MRRTDAAPYRNAPSRRPASTLAPRAALIRLQRTYGNRATLAWLQQMRPAVQPTSSGLLVQREVDVGTVQVDLDPATGRIANSHFAPTDRPEGSIRGEEGSHTTAWVVTLEGIRTAIQGKTLGAAIAEIDRIYTLAKKLPGAQADRVNALSSERQGVLQEATAIADAAKADAIRSATLEHLQSYIGAVMTYRNSIPLTAAKRGGLANYALEDQHIAVLKNPTAHAEAKVRAAIFGLLDTKAVFDYANPAFEEDEFSQAKRPPMVSFDQPGSIRAEQPATRVKAIIKQHLKWVKGLYPQAYARANISDQNILTELLAPRGEVDFGDTRGFQAGAPSAPLFPQAPTATARNDRFAVEVVVAGGKVATVWVKGRPPGVFGSTDKKHMTAWTVFVNGVYTKTVGLPLNAAITAMKNLFTDAKNLPGAKDEHVHAMSAEAEARFTDARATASTAEANATNAQANPSADIKQSALQLFISAYLAYRNAMPLSAAHITSQVSTTGGKSEGNSIKTLDRIEETARGRYTPKADKLSAIEAIWKLLDWGGVATALKTGRAERYNQLGTSPHGVKYHTNVPGIDTEQRGSDRVTDIVVQHLKSIEVAYPKTMSAVQELLSARLDQKLKKQLGSGPSSENAPRLIRKAMAWPRLTSG